jgi:hypothetical protein
MPSSTTAIIPLFQAASVFMRQLLVKGGVSAVPGVERTRTQAAATGRHAADVVRRAQVPYDIMDGKEALCLCSRSKVPHVALALPRGLVGDFGPVVGVTRGVMHDRRLNIRLSSKDLEARWRLFR